MSVGGIDRALAVAPTPAFTWDATGTSDYNTVTNWNPDLTNPPANTDNQFLTINNGATAAVNGDSQGAFLILGLSTGQSGNLVINAGTSTFGELRVGGRETVPDDYNSATPNYVANNGGTGTVVQNPGTTVNVNYAASSEPPVASMYVGDSSGLAGNTANGSYTITGTVDAPSFLTSGFLTNDAIVVGTGIGTVGTFTQNDFTTVTSTGFINIGRRGATGTYNLNGGTLSANAGGTNTGLFIGDGDTAGVTPTSGTFNQTGGTFTVSAGFVLIGRRNGEGTYNISGGSFNATGEVRVPDLGSTTAGLGNAKGTLNVSGTGSFTVGGNLNIGLGSSSVASNVIGTLTQTGGTVELTGVSSIMAVGNGIGATGTVNLSAGTINVLGASSLIDIGRTSATGTFNVSGTGTLNAHQITVNSTSVAVNRTLNISGGTVDLDILTFGTVASQATRLLDISGGTVNIGALTTGQATGAGSALTYIHGGTVTLENTVEYFTGSTFRLGTINLSVPASTTHGNATVDVLTGSTLTQTGSFGTGASSRTLTKTGPGTMTIAGTQSYSATATANITAGTMNYNTAVPGSNLAVNTTNGAVTNFNATGNNLRLLSVDTGGTVNIGANSVNSTGAVTLTNGSITGTTGVITGASYAMQNGSVSAILGGSGALTKTTGSTVTLSGANTYTGGTTVSVGKLELAAPAATLGTGNVTVSGATLGTFLAIDNGVLNGIANSATLSLAGGGTATLADQGYADLGSNVSERVGALLLASAPQTFGLTYGSLASSAVVKSDEFFAGTGVVAVGTPGDFNNSGQVDAGDYVTWRKNPAAFGGTAGYDLWRQNFGAVFVPGAGAGLGGNQAVPEPGSLLLTAAGVLFAYATRRRR